MKRGCRSELAGASEQIADRRGVPSPASRSGPAASMSKLSVYLYADSWRCSGRHDVHRVFPFGSRKTWSLNVLPHLVQSNGVVGLATGRRWLLRRDRQERRRHAPGGAPGATLVRRTRLSRHLLENPGIAVG